MKRQLLKWGAIVMVLLGVVLFATAINPYAARAASLQEAPPPADECELTYQGSGGGTTSLDLGFISNSSFSSYDAALAQTLVSYNLLCDHSVAMPTDNTCTLVPASYGAFTMLYLGNIQQQSSWIYNRINTDGGFSVDC